MSPVLGLQPLGKSQGSTRKKRSMVTSVFNQGPGTIPGIEGSGRRSRAPWLLREQIPVDFEGTDRDKEEGSEGVLWGRSGSMASGHQAHNRLDLEHQEALHAQGGS